MSGLNSGPFLLLNDLYSETLPYNMKL